jgi:hypothetical protein
LRVTRWEAAYGLELHCRMARPRGVDIPYTIKES